MNTSSRNVTYSTVGDYQLPNLTLNQPRKPLGKYGRLRRTYLKDHRPVLYNTMLLNGTLYPHLMEVERTAESQMQQTMAQLLKQNPAPDKEQNQMAWVQHMNSLKTGTMLAQFILNFSLRQNKSGGRFFALRLVDGFNLFGFGGNVGIEET